MPPFASHLVLDWCLHLLVSVKTKQMVTNGDLICMVGDAKMLSPVKFDASIGGTEPGRSRTSVSVLPAVRSRRFSTGYWWFNLLSIISDSDYNNLLMGTRGLQWHTKCALRHQVRPSTRCAKTNHAGNDSSSTRIVLLTFKHDGFTGNFDLRFVRLLWKLPSILSSLQTHAHNTWGKSTDSWVYERRRLRI